MNKLEANVDAVNRAHAYANYIDPILRAIFEPFVGQKILKQDGTLMEKYRKLVPAFENTNSLCVFKRSTDYSLAWTVRTCSIYPESSHHSAFYYEITVYICDINGAVLSGMCATRPDAKADYKVEDIQKIRQEVKEAEKALDAIKRKLGPFTP